MGALGYQNFSDKLRACVMLLGTGYFGFHLPVRRNTRQRML